MMSIEGLPMHFVNCTFTHSTGNEKSWGELSIEEKARKVKLSLEDILDCGVSNSTKLEVLDLLVASQQISHSDYMAFVDDYELSK